MPGASVGGTTIFICARPMKPGVRPAKETVAAAEPIFAEYAEVAQLSVLVDAGVPSLTAGATGPVPVR